jgi:hypothetical protein
MKIVLPFQFLSGKLSNLFLPDGFHHAGAIRKKIQPYTPLSDRVSEKTGYNPDTRQEPCSNHMTFSVFLSSIVRPGGTPGRPVDILKQYVTVIGRFL